MDDSELDQYIKDAVDFESDFDIDNDLLDIESLIEDTKQLGVEMESAAQLDYTTMDTSDPDIKIDDNPPVEEEKPKPTPIVFSPPSGNVTEPKFSPTTSCSDEEENPKPAPIVFSPTRTNGITTQKTSMPSQNWRIQNQQINSDMPQLICRGRPQTREELQQIMKNPEKMLKLNVKKYNLDKNRMANKVRKPGGDRINELRAVMSAAKAQGSSIRQHHNNNHYRNNRAHPYQHMNHQKALQRFDLRDKLPYRPSHMPHNDHAMMPGPSSAMGLPMVPFQNQIAQFMQMMPLLQSPQVVEGVNQAFGAKYDMDTQRKIAEIQNREFRYTCDTLAPITTEGAGIDTEITAKGGSRTMNMRFS